MDLSQGTLIPQHGTIRYQLCDDARYLWPDAECKGERFRIPHPWKFTIFADILEQKEFVIKLKLYLPEGQIVTGWTGTSCFPLKIFNMDRLFDGRFNA